MSFDTDDGGGWGASNNAPMRAPQNQARSYQGGDQDHDFVMKIQQIDSGIYKLSSNVVNMSKMVEKYGSKFDDHALREQVNQLRGATVKSFKTIENNIKALVPKTPKQRLQQDQMSKRLQSALEQFRSCCENAVQKDKNSLVVDRERAASFRKQQQYEEDEEDEHASLMAANRRREQEQLHAQMQFNQDMIMEREAGMQEIESTMLEINEIFRDLSIAVHDQGGMLDSIEANMTAADAHVESGTGQLTKASDYQKKARSKMMCLLVIVAIVAAILVIVLVTQLKK